MFATRVQGHIYYCIVNQMVEVDEDAFTPLPYGDGHCTSCHCTCNPDGPFCNHWIGCPGC